jgi:putative hydrolase of the HAD superfamily
MAEKSAIAMLKPISGVLFDLDNTLIDRDLAFAGWARQFATSELLVTDDTEVQHVVAWLTRLDAGGYGAKPAMFEAIRTTYPRFTGDAQMRADQFPHELRQHLSPPDTRTMEMLAGLGQDGIPWGIVTNGSPTQLKKIERAGLGHAGCIIVSGIVGIRKPERAIFEDAAQGIRIEPAQVLFVGDNIEADILGAANAGMRTAWMRRGRTWPANDDGIEPDYIIDHIGEVTELLKSAKAPNAQGFSRVPNIS